MFATSDDRMVISRTTLVSILVLVSVSCIGCSYASNKFFVPANTVVEIEDYGMCSSLKVYITAIHNVTNDSNLSDYNTWVAIEGFIDGEYVGQCNSTSSCKLQLSRWTTGHTFTYYFSSNTDAYFDYDLTNGECGVITFYIIFGTFVGLATVLCCIAMATCLGGTAFGLFVYSEDQLLTNEQKRWDLEKSKKDADTTDTTVTVELETKC